MPRSAEAKLRRRNRKKDDNDKAMEMLGGTAEWDGDGDDDDDDDDDVANDDAPMELFPIVAARTNIMKNEEDNLPKQKKMKKKTNNTTSDPSIRGVPKSSSSSSSSSKGGGIKTTPLILLILMIGTTLIPAVIFAGDYVSKIFSKTNVLGNIGFRLGIGAVPKKRVLSFYEKHAPEKLDEVPTILSKHYGSYPTLIKKLERKYQDYGYFLGWEEDEAPMRIAMEQLQETYDVWISQYWNKYSPQVLKTAFRNIRYNLTFLVKKGKRLWKKHAWPVLEPIFGVPDGAAAQKRKDAAEAKKRKAKATKNTATRQKNRDFRDDVED